MKYGRVITAAVCAAVLLAALCGCGDTPQEVSDPATTASTTTTTTAEETTTTTGETTADTTTATTPKSTTKKPTTTTTTKKPTTTTIKPTTTTTITIPANPDVPMSMQHVAMVDTILNEKKLDIESQKTMIRHSLPLSFSKTGLWVTCVSSVAELDAFKQGMLDAYAKRYSDKSDEEFRNGMIEHWNAQIEQTYSQYDAAYFNDRSLAMVFLPYISSSERGTVTNFVRQGNEICIDWIFHFPKSGAVSNDVNPRYILVEMKSEDLVGVEKWSHHKTIEYY